MSLVVAVDFQHLNDVGVPEILQHPDLSLKAFPRPLVLGSESHALDRNRRGLLSVECLGDDRLRAVTLRFRQGVAVAKDSRCVLGFYDHDDEDASC